jgi:hypothetical protein
MGRCARPGTVTGNLRSALRDGGESAIAGVVTSTAAVHCVGVVDELENLYRFPKHLVVASGFCLDSADQRFHALGVRNGDPAYIEKVNRGADGSQCRVPLQTYSNVTTSGLRRRPVHPKAFRPSSAVSPLEGLTHS